MLTELYSREVWYFAICVGIAAMCVLDLWCMLARAVGISVINWGMLGRWIFGLFRGRTNVCDSCHFLAERQSKPRPAGFAMHILCSGPKCREMHSPMRRELILGWTLHYVFGVGWALLLPLLWGQGYISNPTLAPAILVGFCMTTLVGQCIVLPALERKHVDRRRQAPMVHGLLLSGNAIFAMALYTLARQAADYNLWS